jgi:hypothetical protein
MRIILDIDGTLADATHRLHYIEHAELKDQDWKGFLKPDEIAKDLPIPEAQRVVNELKNLDCGPEILFLTGRNESLREVTTNWLLSYFVDTLTSDRLLMRPVDNAEKPTVYKTGHLKKLDPKVGEWYSVPPTLCFDDDPYMQTVYMSFGFIPFLAPRCWEIMFNANEDLLPETYWRK